MIVISRYFFYKNYVGLSLWPFIILKDVELQHDDVLINHEKIHLKQQQELFIFAFYFFYVLEWLVKTIWYLNGYRAYQNLSFEREAYANEDNLKYLDTRSSYCFIKYLWY
jgi:hypothetical protein